MCEVCQWKTFKIYYVIKDNIQTLIVFILLQSLLQFINVIKIVDSVHSIQNAKMLACSKDNSNLKLSVQGSLHIFLLISTIPGITFQAIGIRVKTYDL
jgi:hypothetical protein